MPVIEDVYLKFRDAERPVRVLSNQKTDLQYSDSYTLNFKGTIRDQAFIDAVLFKFHNIDDMVPVLIYQPEELFHDQEYNFTIQAGILLEYLARRPRDGYDR